MIEGVLPTFLAVSSISASNVLITLIGFIVFYSTLAIVDVYLMVKTIRPVRPTRRRETDRGRRARARPRRIAERQETDHARL